MAIIIILIIAISNIITVNIIINNVTIISSIYQS